MSTSYERLYENLLPKFRSYDIPLMSEEEVKDYLSDYIVPAVSRFHVCKKDLSLRDNDLGAFKEDLDDIEVEIISNYMLIEYIDSNFIRTQTLLKVNLSSADFHSFSSANMLDKLLAMHAKYLSENETLLSRYAWSKVDTKSFGGYNKST